MFIPLMLTGVLLTAEVPEPTELRNLTPALFEAALVPALSPSGLDDFHHIKPTTTWQISATLDESVGTIGGTALLTWRNDEAAPIPDLCLQTLANGAAFHEAALTISDLRVNGAQEKEGVAVTGEPFADGAYLRVRLAAPLAPGATLTLSCHFITTPSRHGGLYGLLSRTSDGWCLYAWHPEVALRRDGEWAVEDVQEHTDPTRTATAHALFTLDVPTDLVVVAGGLITRRQQAAGARTTLTIAAPFNRNQVLILSRGLVSESRTENGITVNSWHRPGLEIGGRRVLDACSGSISLYSERFGAYPFTELDAVAASLGPDIGGMESTGLVIMDEKAYEGARYLDDNCGPSVLPIFMLMVCAAHETGHQWWYSTVGNDPYHDPWLDESLTNWTGNFYMEQHGGPGAGGLAFGMCLTQAGMGKRDAPMTKSIPDYPSFEAYGGVIYARGALFYQWLRRRMGDERFFAFLRAWYSEHRWTITTPADWHTTLKRFATPEILIDVEPWLTGIGLTPAMMVEGIKPPVK